MRSLAFVLDGSCKVVNNYEYETEKGKKERRYFEVFELRVGNHFGASDLLKIADMEYLGDIVAGDKGAKIMLIERPDQVIQLCE